MNRTLYPLTPWLTWVVASPLLLIVVLVVAWMIAPEDEIFVDAPHWAWLLPGVFGMSLWLLWVPLRRRAAMRRMAHDLTPWLMIRAHPTRPALRAGLEMLGLVFLLTAALGPRWGRGMEKLESYGVDIVVAVDVSRSMLAEDVAPDRLQRAKQEIERLTLDPAHRLGLLAFAGSASMKVPLTLDHAFFLKALDDLNLDSAPRGGTAIAEAIYAAQDFFASSAEGATRVILVFTDGENHEGDPVAATREVAQSVQARIFTIGVGDPALPAGAQVPSAPGSRTPLIHDGQIVFSKLNMEVLERVAQAGGGQAVHVASFKSVVDQIARMHRQRIEGEERVRFQPRYQVFLALGLACLSLAPIVRESPRRRADRLTRALPLP